MALVVLLGCAFRYSFNAFLGNCCYHSLKSTFKSKYTLKPCDLSVSQKCQVYMVASVNPECTGMDLRNEIGQTI